MMDMNVVIVLAAGEGTRFDNQRPKQFVHFGGNSMLGKSLNTFLQSPLVDKLVVVVSREHGDHLLSEDGLTGETDSRLSFVYGGATRGESIRNGLQWCLENLDLASTSRLLVHDSCRPSISNSLIEKILSFSRKDHDAWVTFEPPGDAIAITKPSGEMHVQVASDGVRALHTPIALSLNTAHLVVDESNEAYTRGLAAFLIDKGMDMGFIETDGSTRKITYSYDLSHE
jgi:2-C-methyl-D-erythritol 4-phosphate cytidylyltransferase